MPGFTPTSVYPKLMAELGINYSNLITKLIKSAFEPLKS
jgi:D-alanine-D-alanine ligase